MVTWRENQLWDARCPGARPHHEAIKSGTTRFTVRLGHNFMIGQPKQDKSRVRFPQQHSWVVCG